MRRFAFLSLIALLVVPIFSPLVISDQVYAADIASTDQERIKKYYLNEFISRCLTNGEGDKLQTRVSYSDSNDVRNFIYKKDNDVCYNSVRTMVENIAPGVAAAEFFKFDGAGFSLDAADNSYRLSSNLADNPTPLQQSALDIYNNGRPLSDSAADIRVGEALVTIQSRCESVDKLARLADWQSGTDQQKIQASQAEDGKNKLIIGSEIENNTLVSYIYRYESKSTGSVTGTRQDCAGAIRQLSQARSNLVETITEDLARKKYDAFIASLQDSICTRSYPGIAAPGGWSNQDALNECRQKVKNSYEECASVGSPRPAGSSNSYDIDTSRPVVNCFTNAMTAGLDPAAQEALRALMDEAFEQARSDADNVQPAQANSGSTEAGDEETAVVCNIGFGLGWIICPAVRFLAGVTDVAYGYVTDMLTVPASIILNSTDGAAGSLYEPWSIMRNVANVAFVIAFLIIIYSQITSMGVSNYGIKKMLPRLIVAALLVNTSFWIAGIAVDVSNVVGETTYRVIDGVNLYSGSGTSTNSQGQIWTNLAEVAVSSSAGVATAGAVATGLLSISIFLPIIVASALTIMLTVIILTVRQAFIIGLIVIAPLAFVAYLLPNTEEWFKRWWSVFRTLLILFPVIAFIFSVSQLAAQVLQDVADTAYDGSGLQFVFQVMAAGVQILPLFLMTILTNITHGVMGRITGMVNNKEKGLIDRSKNLARDRQKYRWNAAKAGEGRRIPFTGGRFDKFNDKIAGGFTRATGANWRDRRRRSREADMDRFDKDMETGWRGSKDGQTALGKLDLSQDKLETAKLDVEVKNIKNNQDVKADLAIGNLKLDQAKSELGEAVSKEVAENTTARGMEGSLALRNKYVADTAKSNSERMTQHEIAQDVYHSTDLQNAAAGADTKYGGRRAMATAKQTLDKLHDERVAAEKSRLSAVDNSELLRIKSDPNSSVEEQSAAVGLISSRSHRASQNKMWQDLYEEMRAADDTFNDPTSSVAAKEKAAADIDRLATLQQQATQDMKEKPFGLGDRAAGQAQIGAYGRRTKDEAGNVVMPLPSFNEEFEQRLGAKTSGAFIPNMNPDDVNWALELARTGSLNPTQKAGLGQSILAAYSNKQYNDAIKGQQRQAFDEILDIVTKP